MTALIEVSFADDAKRFDCAACPIEVQELRRCHEDRFDFGPEDAAFFPIRVSDGGTLFGFCPGKATWYPDVAALYRMLSLVAETGTMPYEGGLMDQPDWIIELLGYFVPRYKAVQFSARARSILGNGKATPGAMSGAHRGHDDRRASGKGNG